MDYQTSSFELKREPDETGTFEGYASVFGVVDQGFDLVEKGAFKDTLTKRKAKMLWQHDMAQPIGVWEAIKEDDQGLHVKGRLLADVRQGAEAIALMKAGAIDSLSIGYRTVEATKVAGSGVRKLLAVDLFEISIVTFPMLPNATVTSMKSIQSIRDFEKTLRDVGFSQSDAKAIAAAGYKGFAAHRDDAGQVDFEAIAGLSTELNRLKELFR